MKRLSLLIFLLLLASVSVSAQTSGKPCQAGQLKPALDACLTLLQQLCGAPGSELVTITKAAWYRLRQDAAQMSEVKAEIPALIAELEQTRNKLNSL